MSLHLQTSTAADLLTFKSFTDTSGASRWTRVENDLQEWMVSDWDGETYFVRFANNFSKKHLATFSKDQHRTREAAYYAWLNSGGATEAGDNWRIGEHQLMTEKMHQTVANRAVVGVCKTCAHAFKKHTGTGGACTQTGCKCTKFTTDFIDARIAAGKPDINPLAGAQTSTVTFIVLNWVPKGEFESVIARSIQAHEKKDGWSIGKPLDAKVGDEVVLKWDFGAHRHGAVVTITKNSDGTFTPHKHQGCHVLARKTATDWKRQTWKILHLESKPPHAPF